MGEAHSVRMTTREYLARERSARTKSEYVNGTAVAMAGGSPRHNVIAANLISELHRRLRDGPCVVLSSDQRIAAEKTGLYTYPDVAVVCEQPRFHPDDADTIVNPVVVIEVLSGSTEAYDRGAKFGHYRRIPTLQEYVLVSQGHHRVEHHRRLDDGRWVLTEYEGDDAAVELPALSTTVPLSEIYAKAEVFGSDPESTGS